MNGIFYAVNVGLICGKYPLSIPMHVGFTQYVDSQETFDPNGPESETTLGLLALMGPITNKGYCSGTLTVRFGERRFTTQAAVNRLKNILGGKDSSGNLVPLQTIEPADLIGPQIALLALFLKGGKTFKQACEVPCLIASTSTEVTSNGA